MVQCLGDPTNKGVWMQHFGRGVVRWVCPAILLFSSHQSSIQLRHETLARLRFTRILTRCPALADTLEIPEDNSVASLTFPEGWKVVKHTLKARDDKDKVVSLGCPDLTDSGFP